MNDCDTNYYKCLYEQIEIINVTFIYEPDIYNIIFLYYMYYSLNGNVYIIYEYVKKYNYYSVHDSKNSKVPRLYNRDYLKPTVEQIELMYTIYDTKKNKY